MIGGSGDYILVDVAGSIRKKEEKLIDKAKTAALKVGVIADTKLSETLSGHASSRKMDGQ
jgi:hypothetical protein